MRVCTFYCTDSNTNTAFNGLVVCVEKCPICRSTPLCDVIVILVW